MYFILFADLAHMVNFSKGRRPGPLLLMYVFLATNTCYLVGRERLVSYFNHIFKNGPFQNEVAFVENLSLKW